MIKYYKGDPCASFPCKNGAECINTINDYQCKCTIGWRGKDCERMF